METTSPLTAATRRGSNRSLALRALGSRVWIGLVAAVIVAGVERDLSAATLCGHWKGRWQSCTDRFKGTVNARITQTSAHCFRAVFTGRAFLVMPYRYTVTLRGHRDPETGIVHFRCHTKLPLWGKYWMSGYATDCKFVAKYRTDDHVGYFVMRRHR